MSVVRADRRRRPAAEFNPIAPRAVSRLPPHPSYNALMDGQESRILKDALKLPPEARAAIAGSLLDSLDQPPDPDAEALWEAEVASRVQQLNDRTVSLVPWSEARRSIIGEE